VRSPSSDIRGAPSAEKIPTAPAARIFARVPAIYAPLHSPHLFPRFLASSPFHETCSACPPRRRGCPGSHKPLIFLVRSKRFVQPSARFFPGADAWLEKMLLLDGALDKLSTLSPAGFTRERLRRNLLYQLRWHASCRPLSSVMNSVYAFSENSLVIDTFQPRTPPSSL